MTRVLTPATSKTQSEPTATTRRVLVVVDDACTAPDLCTSVRVAAAGRPTEALVVAPAHGTSFAQWYVDEDAARAEATHRLRTCIRCLARDGIRVQGRLGDADPILAIADALHEFDAEEILLVTAARSPSRLFRSGVVAGVRRTFAQPVRVVAMPQAEERR